MKGQSDRTVLSHQMKRTDKVETIVPPSCKRHLSILLLYHGAVLSG